MIREKYKTVGFNENLEADFLASLDNFEMRRQVLEKEVATAVNEVFLHKFENGYDFIDGKIIDKVTKRPIENLVINCGREPEIEAMTKIQELLKERELVVHFSPKNEEYDYPMDCIDFWWQNGKEARWMRVVVNDNFESLQQVYESIGGEKKNTVMEMLSSPIGVDDVKIGDVLAMLDTADEINKITDEKIKESVRILMDGFVEKFNEEIVENPEVIFRLFSAAIAEAKKINSESWEEESSIDTDQMWEYLNAEMEMRTMMTSGCASINNVGEFNRGAVMYLVQNGDGGFTIVKGEAPEGYKLCEHCGLYYKGDKCPICD